MAYWIEEADLPWMVTPGEYVYRFDAVDPTTGAAVSGVTVRNIAIQGEPQGSGGTLERIIPALTPDEIEALADG